EGFRGRSRRFIAAVRWLILLTLLRSAGTAVAIAVAARAVCRRVGRPRRRALAGNRHRERSGSALDLDALLLQHAEQIRLRGGPRIVGGEHVAGRTFSTRLEDRSLALQIEVAQEQLSVAREVVHCREQPGLLVVVVVALRP